MPRAASFGFREGPYASCVAVLVGGPTRCATPKVGQDAAGCGRAALDRGCLLRGLRPQSSAEDQDLFRRDRLRQRQGPRAGRSPTSTAAWRSPTTAIRRAPWPTIARRCAIYTEVIRNSAPSGPARLPARPDLSRHGRCRSGDRRLQRRHPPGAERDLCLRQPRHRALHQEGQQRRRHRRLQHGAQDQPLRGQRLDQPRPRLQAQG